MLWQNDRGFQESGITGSSILGKQISLARSLARTSVFMVCIFILGCIPAVEAFTLRGRIIDEKQVLENRLTEEEAEEATELDPFLHKKIFITAHVDNKTTITVNPDSGGFYRIDSLFLISELTLEDDRGKVYLSVQGQWAKDDFVDLELSKFEEDELE